MKAAGILEGKHCQCHSFRATKKYWYLHRILLWFTPQKTWHESQVTTAAAPMFTSVIPMIPTYSRFWISENLLSKLCAKKSAFCGFFIHLQYLMENPTKTQCYFLHYWLVFEKWKRNWKEKQSKIEQVTAAGRKKQKQKQEVRQSPPSPLVYCGCKTF